MPQWKEEDCMRVHSKGTQDENGQALIDWLLQRQLFLCNTAFQHPSCHHTMWEGYFNPPGYSTTVPVYYTIDYIVTPTKYHSLLCDSHRYAGIVTSNDYRLMVSRVHLSKVYKLWHKQTTSNEDCITMSELVHQKPRRIEYVHWVRESITAVLNQPTTQTAQHWLDSVRHIVHQLLKQQREWSLDILTTMAAIMTLTTLPWPVNKNAFLCCSGV